MEKTRFELLGSTYAKFANWGIDELKWLEFLNNLRKEEAVGLVNHTHVVKKRGTGDGFPLFKTIELGTHENIEALEDAILNAGMGIMNYTRLFMEQVGFRLSPKKTKINLTAVSKSDLSLPETATLAEVLESGKGKGLYLCPPETGPQLRRQYLHQPVGESLLIVTEGIELVGGGKGLFRVYNPLDGQKSRLGSEDMDLSQTYYGYSKFVFMLPRHK